MEGFGVYICKTGEVIGEKEKNTVGIGVTIEREEGAKKFTKTCGACNQTP